MRLWIGHYLILTTLFVCTLISMHIAAFYFIDRRNCYDLLKFSSNFSMMTVFPIKTFCTSCVTRLFSFSSMKHSLPLQRLLSTKSDTINHAAIITDVSKPKIADEMHEVTTSTLNKTDFPNVIHKINMEVGFWQSEQGLYVKDTVLTYMGRVIRMLVSVERYDNSWENSMILKERNALKFNAFDEAFVKKLGAELGMGNFIFKLGGSLKLVTDDRWVDNSRNLRVPAKKDFTIEAIDLRNSIINYDGTKYFEHLGFVRYLNLGNCHLFDNYCMTRLHPIADTLEYLDISGTAVTPEAFSYLRIFPKLKWLNISRISTDETLEKIVPFLLEILPPDCAVVTNDQLPSESYGTEIPYRSLKNPAKDVLLEEYHEIGDPVAFSARYGVSAVNLTDVTQVHQMWKTPLISRTRCRHLKNVGLFQKKLMMQTMVEYIHKAEQYRPLL